MKQRTISLLGAIVAIALLITACTAPAAPAANAPAAEVTTSSTASESTTDGEPLKVVLFVNGVLGDKSFFDSAQRGVDRAKAELGIEAKTIEAGLDETTWEPALTDAMANEEYDVFIVGTFQTIEYLQALAPQHPDKKFIIFDAPVDYAACANQCANVYSITYKQNEGSYLAGVYAAAMTTQMVEGMNEGLVIGSIGGQDIPVILDFMIGYEQGATDTQADIQVIRQFVGGGNPWNDPAKGKELAKAQYSQGADIIFQIAAGSGQGVFEAAAEDGRYALGVDSDQALIVEGADPAQAERILTSMLKNVDNSLFRALQLHIDGTAPYGEIEALGIAEGGVGLARNKYYEENTPDEVKQIVDAAEQKLINGEITVATAFE